MKERPILMTPENGQKSYDEDKTQTRRMNELDEVNRYPDKCTYRGFSHVKEAHNFVFKAHPEAVWRQELFVKCPYGVPGDRLWIREACWIYGRWKENGRRDNKQRWAFEAHSTNQVRFDQPLYPSTRRPGDHLGWGWVRRPGIFMPRWACRTVVEITEIRVQRIQEISHDDAIAEGLSYEITTDVPCSNFRDLWISINGPDSWAQNPWVFAISYRRIDK